MELNKYAIAAIFSGLILSPTAVLAFGATVHTDSNFQSGEVSAEVIEKAKANSQKRLAIKEVNCVESAAGDTTCGDSDADENTDGATTISN